jgi:methylenetetrahydrofolate reductase (NADPH)
MNTAASRWSVRHADWMAWLYRGFERTAPVLGRALARLPKRPLERAVLATERVVKQSLFDCQMCGQCGLSVTGMACPNGCAKQMRNGPCGGVRPDGHCEVHPDRPCTWVGATEGDALMARKGGATHTPTWTARALPADHRRWGRSTWVPMVFNAPPPPTIETGNDFSAVEAAPSRIATADMGSFERLCVTREKFIVTVELTPPDSVDASELLRRAEKFRGLADAINITDGAGANCHMSSAAASVLLATAGYTPIAQFSCRDRNRIALQGDVLGAAALGVRHILCLTGDDVSQGDIPEAKPVFDLDAVNMLHTFRVLSEQGTFSSGRKLEKAPRLFLGATANPFMPPFEERVANLRRKIDAGASFVQTQFCFDVERFERFMAEVRAAGLHERAAIIVGVGALQTAKGLRRMANKVPGVHVPQEVIDRIASAADPREAGIEVGVELVQRLRRIEGVAGVHMMGYRSEDMLAQIIIRAGLASPAPVNGDGPRSEGLRRVL